MHDGAYAHDLHMLNDLQMLKANDLPQFSTDIALRIDVHLSVDFTASSK
jgi:hypothetical protein